MESNTTQPFSLAEKVKEIKDRGYESFDHSDDLMKGLSVELNETRKIIYLSAPIRPEQLDKGTDPQDCVLKQGLGRSIYGDTWHSYIPKKLGGNLKWFPILFPINDQLSLKEWEEDENRVYEYLSSSKQGEDRSVLLEFGIEYNEFFEDEWSRPYLIHRIFHFFINGQPSDLKPIEGTFVNTSPRLTQRDVYARICIDDFCFKPFIRFIDQAGDLDEENKTYESSEEEFS